MSTALPRVTQRQPRRASPLAALLVLSCSAFGAGAQPDLDWIDRDAVAAREVLVYADRGDRPLTVQVQARGRGRRCRRQAIWDVLKACEIAPEYVPNVVSCKKLEELDGGRADLFVQTIKPIFFMPTFEHVFRLDYTPYTRIDVQPCQRADRAHARKLVAPAAGQWPHPARLRARARPWDADSALHGPRDVETRPAEGRECRPRARRSRGRGREVTGEGAPGGAAVARQATFTRRRAACESGHREAVAELVRLRGCGAYHRQRAAHPDPGARQQGPLHADCVTP